MILIYMQKWYLNFFIGVILALVSCKNEQNKPKEASNTPTIGIQFIENPASGKNSLPRLFGTDEKLYLSWVEKNDSVATLKYAVLTNGDWSKEVVVSSGTDWFVNWADFPAIAENNGAVLTNVLQKSAKGTYTYDIKLNIHRPSNTKVS